LAQQDPRLISARAGFVNFVTGEVMWTPVGQGITEALAADDELNSGDVIKTGADGRVEVLLNPGSYLRVGANAEFEMTDNSLDRLTIKLNRGGAIIEATVYSDSSAPQFVIGVNTPRGRVSITRSGLYRINVAQDGTSELAVYKGGASVGDGLTTVKSGQVATLNGDGATLAKLDTKNHDDLDLWSKARAEELAKANNTIQHNPTVINALANYNPYDTSLNGFGGFDNWFYSPFGSGYGCVGYWVYSRRLHGRVFVPCLTTRVTSPYGYSYNCRLQFTPPRTPAAPTGTCRGCAPGTTVQGRRGNWSRNSTGSTSGLKPAKGSQPGPMPVVRQHDSGSMRSTTSSSGGFSHSTSTSHGSSGSSGSSSSAAHSGGARRP
jgi:hypothetical protein